MAGADKRARFRNAFGAALDAQLQKAGISQAQLAASVKTSRAYVNQTMTGAAAASPQWADTVAETLTLSDRDRGELHAAAASSRGYRLDLLKKKKKRDSRQES